MSILPVFFIHLLALASPGPDFVFISQTAISCSHKQTLAAISGVCAAIGVWSALAISGLSFIIERVPVLYQFSLLLGGGYLLCLGILSIKSCFKAYQLVITVSKNQQYFFLKGLITNLSNPKALVYFTSIFSVAITHASSHLIMVMVIVILIESFFWFYLVARFFSTDWMAKWYQKRLRLINFMCGLAFIGFSLGLLWQFIKTLY